MSKTFAFQLNKSLVIFGPYIIICWFLTLGRCSWNAHGTQYPSEMKIIINQPGIYCMITLYCGSHQCWVHFILVLFPYYMPNVLLPSHYRQTCNICLQRLAELYMLIKKNPFLLHKAIPCVRESKSTSKE